MTISIKDDVVYWRSYESGVGGLKGKGVKEWGHLFTDFALQNRTASRKGIFTYTVFFLLDELLDADVDHAFLVDVVEDEGENDK